MLASFPASMENQKAADLGIQNRFNIKSFRFSHCIGKIASPTGE
jgi:hypothetical protein